MQNARCSKMEVDMWWQPTINERNIACATKKQLPPSRCVVREKLVHELRATIEIQRSDEVSSCKRHTGTPAGRSRSASGNLFRLGCGKSIFRKRKSNTQLAFWMCQERNIKSHNWPSTSSKVADTFQAAANAKASGQTGDYGSPCQSPVR